MCLMKKIVLLMAIICISSYTFYGQTIQPYKKGNNQDGYVFPNVIKVNTLAVPFNNLSLSYERAILPSRSFLFGVGYKYAGRAPSVFSVNGALLAADMDAITGYSLTPEFRYYLKSCEPNFLEGFYAGLYFRYTHYNSGANFNYFPSIDVHEDYSAITTLDEYGIGIQLGYQLVLWKRFNIDFLFFGPRISNYNIKYEFDQNVSQEFLDDLSDYINEVLEKFELDYQVDLEQKGGTKASAGFLFANMRFGISLGFAF